MAELEAPAPADPTSTRTPSSRPSSTRSSASHRASSRTSDESTPLLARNNSTYGGDHDSEDEEATPRATSARGSYLSRIAKSKWPWPSIIALLLLCVFTLAIMLMGFFIPEILEEYALQAAEVDVTSISLPEFTTTGAKARVQGVFWMNPGRVQKSTVRNLGKFGTWVAREVETKECEVQVRLPDYDSILLGTAAVPPMKFNVRSGHRNTLDLLVDLEPGDTDGIRLVSNDWLNGQLEELKVQGKTDIKLKSGFINLPTQSILRSLVIEANKIPKIPAYNISRLQAHEADLPDGDQGIQVDVSLAVDNKFPIDFAVPPLGFDVMIPGCLAEDPLIMIADATIANLQVHPKEDVHVNATGLVRNLPDAVTATCPDSDKSPLDALLAGYMDGEETTVYVKGSSNPSSETPKWISDLISSITVPVPLPGRALGGLIRNFSMEDVEFSLPDPLADPDSPEASPQISAKIDVLVALPEEMNFNADINKFKADSDVFYKGKKLGRLDLNDWQEANSTRIEPHDDEKQPTLLIETVIEDVPIKITDSNVFSDVIQALLFGGKPVLLTVKANVDVKVDTALGQVTVRQVPAEGVVPVKAITASPGFKNFNPKISNLQIVDTSNESMTIQAEVAFTNPTPYSAIIPYIDINILVNDTIMGHATARNFKVGPGNNSDIVVQAVWDPLASGGADGVAIGRELLSQYISGYNTSLTLQTHEGSIPAQPALGKALQALTISFPTPKLGGDDRGDNDDGKPHFIKSATMHLFSSTAEFELVSPLAHSSLFITHINATAMYRGDDVGHIFYGEEYGGLPEEFEVPPGASVSPRLPVDWDLGSVGYEALKRALGGTLRLSAKATVGIRIGEYNLRIWFKGGGIGAHVKL